MEMGDCDAVISDEGEEKLIAAANYLVRELDSTKNLSIGTKKILANLLSKLSLVVTTDDKEGISETKERLNILSEKILSRVADESMIWDSGPNELNDFLNSASQVRILIEGLEDSLGSGKFLDKSKELLRKAHNVLQTAMARLEEEFRNILVQSRLPFETEHLSFRSSEEGSFVDNEGSVNSFIVDSIEDLSIHRENSVGRNSGEIIVDLVYPNVIPDLKNIVDVMFLANYDCECIKIYTTARKDSLDEFLFDYEMDKMIIEDVLRMDWGTLNSKIKKWVRFMKMFVRSYLSSENWLSGQIFGDQNQVGLMCFIDVAKGSMMQLLNFGEAVCLGPRQPEKLLSVLDMFEVAAGLVLDIGSLFSGDAGSPVRLEYQEVMKRLGDCARLTFLEFKNAISLNASTNPYPGGGVHPLTNYVMNYLRALTDYSETLESLLKECDDADGMVPLSPDINDPDIEEDELGKNSLSGKFSVMTRHFHFITDVLETNLLEKSGLYRDAGLKHFFMMNNVYYMAQKAKNTELKHVFGHRWIRNHNSKFQKWAIDYERATWSSILALLKDEGSSSSSPGLRRHSLRDRFQNFFTAFEEVYKIQTAWVITDDRLREDLRISASLKVIQAYRTFYSWHRNQVSDRYIKYTVDDLEKLLLDLFAGSPKSLSNSHRK